MSATVLVLIGTFGILFLVVFIILFVITHQKKMFQNKTLLIEKENILQKKLTEATIVVAELERKRIAANLHDDVGSILNVINQNLSRIERTKDNEHLTSELINDSKLLLANTIENIRGISRDLMPPILVRLGFIKGLEDLCQRLNLSQTITVNLKTETEKFELEKNIEIQLYRIINEIITNILKHAKANNINIIIGEINNNYKCCITHNGIGITNEQINTLTAGSNGLGLKSLQSRIQIINGSLSYDILNDKEASVTVLTPKQ